MASGNEQIFVSLASYRDPETQWTVRSALDRAKNPYRLTFGICWQHDAENDENLFKHMPKEMFDGQIRQIFMRHTEAGGPIYARYLIQNQLYRGEKFYLQIDSHTMFRANFDEDLIKEWKAVMQICRKPIISSYPHGYDGLAEQSQGDADAVFDNDPGPIRLEPLEFNENDGLLRIIGRSLVCSNCHHTGPIRHNFWAAGFSFSEGTIVKECPYDPILFGIFFGEESVMAARLFTSGYDFFVPLKAVLLTKWSRSYRSTFREIDNTPERNHSTRIAKLRLSVVLGCQPIALIDNNDRDEVLRDIEKYGLGKERTLQDYESCAGIGFATRSITPAEDQVMPANVSKLIVKHLGLM